jgi:hypothetical protein
VLFAVTPNDPGIALEKIREALDVYLRLPANPNTVEMVPYGADVKTQLLDGEILHLKSQLMLISATLQQKDIIIAQQRQFIEQQLLGGQVQISSMHQPSQAQPADEELTLQGSGECRTC